MEKINLNEIEKIETRNVVKNLNWFYHGFDFGNIAKIMENGILAKKYLDFSSPNFGDNGKYYISLSKDTNRVFTAFRQYNQMGPMIIVDNIEAIKCRKNMLYEWLRFTPLPFRYSGWDDEYQVYSKILPDKFVGIECVLYDWAKDNNLFFLRRFRDMLEVMQSLDSNLPIYDFSRQEDGIVHELDKEAFLELSKHL